MLSKKPRKKKEKCLIRCMSTSICHESRLNQAFRLNLMGIYFVVLLLYSYADSPNNKRKLMNDSQYNLIAEDLLLAVEEAIEESGVDIDYEGVGGLLTVTFKNNTKIIINKQAPLHEIWIATKFNGHHFAYSDSEEIWIDKRGGDEFWQFLSSAVSIQAETELTLSSE